jgi:hypothetical protein
MKEKGRGRGRGNGRGQRQGQGCGRLFGQELGQADYLDRNWDKSIWPGLHSLGQELGQADPIRKHWDTGGLNKC